MSNPLVIKKLTGAIATIVVYLRGKKKLTPQLKSRVIIMAKKGKPKPKPQEPEEIIGYRG